MSTDITTELKRIKRNKRDLALLLEREFGIQGLFDSCGNAISLKYWKDIIRLNLK